MTNALMNFVYQGRDVRMVRINDKPWFVLTDVCLVLGISNAPQAASRLADDEKMTLEDVLEHSISAAYIHPKATLINEPGLYATVAQSRRPEAQAFRHWIYHEVIPQIQRTHMYIPDGKLSSEFMFRVAEQMAEMERTISEQSVLIEEMKPKVSYYEHVLNSPSMVKTKVIAADYGMTANKLNKLLEEEGVQYREGKLWHLYSKYLGLNYAKYKTILHDPKDPSKGTSEWMYWTQTGRLAIYDLLKQRGILPLMEREAC